MIYFMPSIHLDSDALAVFHVERVRADVSPESAAAGPALWPRFARYYQVLARLPRKARRALQRRWRRSLGGLALLLALGQAPALAATIEVDGTTCNLVDAITAANNDQPTGGCTGGSGADTITLLANSTHTLTAVNNFFDVPAGSNVPVGLPVISSAITIEGNGGTITRDSGAPPFRILTVNLGASLTLKETTVSGGVAETEAGGISNRATLSLINSTVSGNSAPGLFNSNTATATLTNSTISGNSFGVVNRGTLALVDSTVSANSFGGVSNKGTATLTNSTLSGNTGCGIVNGNFGGPTSLATVMSSTVSGNARGICNYDTLTVTNSTISGNSNEYDGSGVYNQDGGGVFNGGRLTLTNSTVSGNSARKGGGILNARHEFDGDCYFGVLNLGHTVVSGNTASFRGREVYSSGNCSSSDYSTVITDNFNLFGRNGISGVHGFTPSPSDIVPNLALIDILDPRLSDNGGPTPTHPLVFGSPAVDAVLAASCATAADQRGVTRPQDDNGDAIANCDIGAFEGAQAPAPPPLVEAEASNPQIPCKDARCQVLVSCNLSQSSGTRCTNRINLFVRASAARLSDEVSARAPRRIRFAFAVANVPPGQTRFVKLKLTKKGTEIVKRKKKLRGVMEIRNTAGTAISSTPITIRLKKRL